MRTKLTIVAAALTASAVTLGVAREAAAQPAGNPIPVAPTVVRDQGWGTVSDVFLAIGVASPLLMPRVYYSDPTSTVGWKGRWHISMLAPALAMAGATVLVDMPIKNEAKGPRPGCDVEATQLGFPGSGCETFGGPSTHAFASWGATGAGAGIFLVDTLKYSDGRFSAPAFIGNVMLPLTSSVFVTMGRAFQNSGDVQPFEDGGQIAAGALAGFFTGLGVGAAYALLQRPSCPYGDAVFCW